MRTYSGWHRRIVFSIIVLFALFACLAIAPSLAHPWATVCEVRTTDIDGNPKVEFAAGEIVYIHWSADGKINMTVYAPDGVTVDQEWIGLLESGVNEFVPSFGNGLYEIDCTGAGAKIIAVGTVLVVPELPILGSLLAVCTMFGAFFIMKRRKTR